MKPVIADPEAEAEVRSAFDYYESVRPGLGRRFLDAFEATILRIRMNPQAAAAFDDSGSRKQRLHRSPYTVYYVELDDSIWIAAVAHQKRRPGYWSDRTPPD